MHLRSALTVLLAAASAAGLGPKLQHSVEAGVTRSRFREARALITKLTRTLGRLPGSTAEICAVGRLREVMPIGQDLRGLLDGWNQPIEYRLLGEEFELRSAGADGVTGTRDDIVFQPSVEAALVSETIGCYEGLKDAWPAPLDRIIVLDATEPAPGAFRLWSVPRGYRAGTWQLLSEDALDLKWMEVHAELRVYLRRSGDTVAGTLHAPGQPARKAVARKVQCPASRDEGLYR